jgi:hypothetical protein
MLHQLKNKILLVVCLVCFCLLTLTNREIHAAPTEKSPENLAVLGLGDLEVISDDLGESVRGQGVGSSGTSVLIGSLIDPSTGSTANFFQIQTSGSSGAQASHTNSINASFEWIVGGLLQRFQAEIGGFGFGFAR